MLHTLSNPNYFCPCSPLPQYLQGIIHSYMRAQPAPSGCRRRGKARRAAAPHHPLPADASAETRCEAVGSPLQVLKKPILAPPGIGSSPEQSKINPKATFMQGNGIVLRTRKRMHRSTASRLERPSVGLGIKIDVGDARMPWQNCVY